MSDYEDQQEMEIEALESILMDDLKELTEDLPTGWRPTKKVYSVEIAPQMEDDQAKESPVLAEVVFSHTATYPDEPPLMKARSLRGLSDVDVSLLQSVLDVQVEENIGMPMIYQLITAAQEWITEKGTALATPVFDPAAEEKRRREAEEFRIAEIRRHGHPVTPESFKEWKAKFDAEMALAKASLQESTAAAAAAAAAAATKGPRLTGKAWFQQQEAQHIDIDEPQLEDYEEDAEGSPRSEWSAEGEKGNYFGKELIEEGSDDDDDFSDVEDDDEMLEEYLNTTTTPAE